MSETRQYTVQLIQEPDGRYTARVPALPEVVTWGDTEDSALENAREAVLLALDVRMAEGDLIPADVPVMSRMLTIAA